MMDKKRKNKLEQLKKRQKPPVTPILVDGKELIDSLESKINEFAKTIDTPITIDNVDDLIDKLSTVPILTSAVESLTEAIKSIEAPNYPNKIELDGIGEVIKLFKQNNSKKLMEDNSKQLKAIIEAIGSMSEAVEKNEVKTAPEDYLPFRRVVKVGNRLVFDDNPTSISNRGGGSSIDTSTLATGTNQTDGSQKTQIVDAGGEVATVTGGKLDVNATASLAGDAIPATGATTAVTVQIADGSGNQITSFGGGTQYSDGDANADPTGTVAMGTDGSNVFALHTDTAGDLQVDVLSMPTTAVTGTFWQATQPVSAASLPLPTGAATAANQQTDALTDTQLRATPVPVSATDLDIRNLAPATDTVAIGDGTSTATVRNLAANDALNVSIVDASGDQITSFGAADGATETTLLSVKTAVETIDNAISGSEMQVDVVAALPAGTNAIGKLAANSGVDIGDVTLNNTLGAGTSDASTIRTTESTGATSTLANVSGSASSVTLVAANTDRRKVVMYNDSTADCYVKYGSTASATSFTWLMAAGSHIEEDCYNGIITGIWTSATGSMRVTEVD